MARDIEEQMVHMISTDPGSSPTFLSEFINYYHLHASVIDQLYPSLGDLVDRLENENENGNGSFDLNLELKMRIKLFVNESPSSSIDDMTIIISQISNWVIGQLKGDEEVIFIYFYYFLKSFYLISNLNISGHEKVFEVEERDDGGWTPT